MTDVIATVRPYLEAAYFLASIALLVGLLFAYRQLQLIKGDMVERSSRAAKEKAIDAVTRYMDNLVPLCTAEHLAATAAKHPRFEGPFGDFSRESVPPQLVAKFSGVALGDHAHRVVPLLNELESISAVFVSEVADEKTGFKIIGRTFCSTMENYYAYIAILRGSLANKYMTNAVELYQMWRPRMSKAELEVVKGQIEASINELNGRTDSAQ